MQRHVRFLSVLCVLLGCPKEPAPAGGSTSQRVEREDFVVELVPPAAVQAGTTAVATVRVEARGKLHVNPDYPLSFTPEPVDGLRYEGMRLALSDAAQRTPCRASKDDVCEMRAPISVGVDRPATLAGTLAFSVCEADRCLIEKVRLAAPVPVK